MNLDPTGPGVGWSTARPLSEADYEKVKDALHAMAAMLVRPRNNEKTSAVLEAFGGAQQVKIAHQNLKHGDRCPECGEGNV